MLWVRSVGAFAWGAEEQLKKQQLGEQVHHVAIEVTPLHPEKKNSPKIHGGFGNSGWWFFRALFKKTASFFKFQKWWDLSGVCSWTTTPFRPWHEALFFCVSVFWGWGGGVGWGGGIMTYVGLAHLLYVMLCLRVLVMFTHKLRFAFLAFVCCCVHQLWESGVCVLALRPVVCTCAFLLRIGYSISCLNKMFCARSFFSNDSCSGSTHAFDTFKMYQPFRSPSYCFMVFHVCAHAGWTAWRLLRSFWQRSWLGSGSANSFSDSWFAIFDACAPCSAGRLDAVSSQESASPVAWLHPR